MYNTAAQEKDLLFAKSIYFDVPIRDMAVISTLNQSDTILLYQVVFKPILL